MTENLTSSSLSSDKADYDKQSSTEIRADIDQTRASVGDKIDQLQARLDPNRLKQQAQETVQEMLNDTASSMTDYVKTHKDEMVTSLADAARRNPLPTALVGLGIGWLILESMAGNRPRDDRGVRSFSRDEGRNDRRYDDRGIYETSYYRQGPDIAQRSYNPPQTQEGYYASSDWSRTGSEFDQGASSTSGQSYNPQSGQGFSQGYEAGAGQNYSQSYNQESRQGAQNYGNGHRHDENPLSKASGAVKDTVGDMTGRAGDVAGDVKDRVSDTVSSVTDSVSNVVGDIRDRVSDAMGGMRQQANEMSNQGQRQFNRAGEQMGQWQNQARYEGQRRGQQVVSNLEDNPLIYGAVALAAGAALAMLLPQSHVENRAFGQMRDQVMTKGQEVLDTAKDHAQQVFEEVRPELEQSARQIVSNVTETGKQAVKDAADQLSPVVDKALTKGKEEARSAAQEVGVDPDKLMANKQGGQSSDTQMANNQQSGGQSGSSQSTMGQSSSKPASSASSSSAGMSGSSTPTASSSSSSASSASGQKSSSQSKTPVLNRDTLAGQWKQVKGEVKRKWGQLTDDDITRAEGDYDKLIGVIQTRYGYTREHVEREINDFFNSQTA